MAGCPIMNSMLPLFLKRLISKYLTGKFFVNLVIQNNYHYTVQHVLGLTLAAYGLPVRNEVNKMIALLLTTLLRSLSLPRTASNNWCCLFIGIT